MCVVSMVMDHYQEKWGPLTWPAPPTPAISPEEVAEFRRLLDRAREYDARNNEPDCEMADKKAAIKRIADQLGVEIDFI
jgi:hypothetical protein